MKTVKFKTLAIAAILSAGVLTIASCSIKEIGLEDSLSDRYVISLTGDIVQEYQTRASDGGFAENDVIGLYVVNYNESTPGVLSDADNQATNVAFTYDGTSTWTPEYDIYYKDKSTHVDFYGYYPYSTAISSVTATNFEVAEDQSVGVVHGQMAAYEASDFLWAKTEDVTPTSNKVMLSFKHKMSSAKVVLVEGEGFGVGEWETLSKSAVISNVKRTANINLSTGVVSVSGSVPARGTVPFANNDGSFRAIVVPQQVSANTELLAITVGGVTYSYSESCTFEYLAGKMHVFNITVDKKTMTGDYNFTVSLSISDWENDSASHDFTMKEYVVVNVETPGTLGQTLTDAGKDVTKIKNLKVTGTVNADDFYFMRDQMTVLSAVNMGEAAVDNHKIPDGAFTGKSKLTSFVFPDFISVIESNAFNGSSLKGLLDLPDSLKIIGYGAFSGVAITNVEFPSKLEEIGERAFTDCYNLLISPAFPNSLKKIGVYAFCSAGFQGNLILPESLEEIGQGAFIYCSGLTGSIIIPAKIKKLEVMTFYQCTGLNGTLSLPEGLEEICSDVFWQCNLKGDLVLPSSLKKIGSTAFQFNSFSSVSSFSDELILSPGAFSDNGRLSGVIEFPEGTDAIPENLFRGCGNILGLILPSSLTVIGPNAFNGCSYISSLVCKAELPPTIGSSAFDEVAKDNFTIEVPEASVNDYIVTPGWSDFKRISAHYDFSVNRNLFRTLNASDSKTVVVRANDNASWTVSAFNSDDTPANWIHPSKASGLGKQEMTISVDNLDKGAGTRTGYVLFSLDGKNYNSKTTVEQYDYEYGDGDVIKHMTHSTGNGVPLVFLGDCYDAKDISDGGYKTDMETAITHFFNVEPYNSYRDYFDVYIVFGLSPDSGIGSVNTIKEAKFGTQYFVDTGKIDGDFSSVFSYAKKAETVDDSNINKSLVTLILNTTEYGGITYMWNDGSAIAICPKSSDPYPYDFRGVVQHEAGGHGFGKLGDEYIYTNGFIDYCNCGYEHLNEFRNAKANGWYDNLSEEGNMNTVPWSHLIFNAAYSSTVDIYEGGFFHTRGIFRSESNSCMNNNVPYFSAISRQAIVERILDYSGEGFTLQKFYDNDVFGAWTKSNVSQPLYPAVPTGIINTKHYAPVIMGDKPEI